jgi:hypothetical protein
MTKELDRFIMLGTDADGNDYTIEMTPLETALYRDSGYGKYLDDAYDVWEQACKRVGIEFDQMPDMITELEETA